jgi:actin-related protein
MQQSASSSEGCYIIDLGSQIIKAGKVPLHTESPDVTQVPNICGFQKLSGPSFLKLQQYRKYDIETQKFSGLEAMNRANQLSLRYPIESGGVIQDYDSIQSILQKIVQTEGQAIALCESPKDAKFSKQRERICEMVFEGVNCSQF